MHGNFVSRKFAQASRANFRYIYRVVALRSNEQCKSRFIALGHSESHYTGIGKARFHHTLNFGRMHAMPLDFNQQVGTTVEVEVPLLVAMRPIASSQPSVFAQDLSRACRVLPVAKHHVLAPRTEHSNDARRQLTSRFVHDRKFNSQ